MEIVENPLCLSILSVLKNTDAGISLFDLMKSLEQQGLDLSGNTDAEVSHEVLLFRKNFVLMNALYALQSEIKESGFFLYISSLKILLYSDKDQLTDLSTDNLEDAKKVDEALSEYYLDWSNFNQADKSYVDALFSSFWKKYNEINKKSFNQDKRSYALQILGVESSASWNHIQQAYRQKVAICHPDKGGTSQQFIEIREAFQFLKLNQ